MGGGGGGGSRQTEHVKIFSQLCSRSTQVTRSNGIHVTDVLARTNCCKLYLYMDMELISEYRCQLQIQ